jgi:hypothetical protein
MTGVKKNPTSRACVFPHETETYQNDAIQRSQAAAVALQGASKVFARHCVLALRIQHLRQRKSFLGLFERDALCAWVLSGVNVFSYLGVERVVDVVVRVEKDEFLQRKRSASKPVDGNVRGVRGV